MKRLAQEEIEVVKENFGKKSRSVLDETFDNSFPVKVPLESSITPHSKRLLFQVKARQNCWYRPCDIKLKLAVKVRQANDARFTDPALAVPATPTYHCRFINDAASHFIKKIQVKPHGGHDIENSQSFLSLSESMRTTQTTSKEEKERYEEIYTRFFHKDLLTGPNQTCAGATVQVKDARQTAAYLLEKYLFDEDTVHLEIGPLPGSFHEIHQPISSLIDYELDIELNGNNYMLISRQASQTGSTGVVRDGAKYVIDLDNTYLLIDYKTLPPEENTKMINAFFSSDKMIFDTFDQLHIASSPQITPNDVATGVEIKPFHMLDNKVPDRFFFGFINSESYDNGGLLTQPGRFLPHQVSKIQIEIDDKPVFTGRPIPWTNTWENKFYLYKLQSDMVAEEGQEERENIGQFLPLNINHGQWWGYIDLTANRKKGFRNRIRKFDSTFSVRIWFDFGGNPAGPNIYFIVGWYEKSELELSEPRNNTWTPTRLKTIPMKIPVKLNNVRDGQR